MIKLTITENQGNQRLDRFLKKYFDNAPLSYIYKMIRKDVKVNGKRSTNEAMVSVGDEITLYISEEEAAGLQKPKRTVKAKKQFTIAYEDDNILVAEKPFGLLTHGDKGEKKNHLANQVVDYLIEGGKYNPRADRTFTPAPANRLDRNTTGLVIFGKTSAALQELNSMIREKDAISKFYMTIVAGKLEKDLHLKDKMVKDTEKNMISVMSMDSEAGKIMETVVHPLKTAYAGGQWFSLVEVEIITGRTHQIRAHLGQAGYPVIGDMKYGSPKVNMNVKKNYGLNTHLLHSYRLKFNRCEKDGCLAYMEGKAINAQLPPDFRRIKEDIFGKN